ncbi:LytR/AlgR family response regulator transcription factor [Psychroserpens luteolus]|uniref:LytR/AlgR family response regulator transcription factor n=1 Tax=Psychroserpens luteolus TaxID=2855840 RepID=UPI001E2A59B8|nr:LytTR family DNA-binding domain-containing protein [Psychroserpens luteolus]MCD2259198.1 LytTR family DNA-binding domain-containing protein [Psychroserpens luteolus]
MNIKCAIVDDEQTARNILRKYVNDVPRLEVVNESKNALEALDYIQNNEIDLIFLDIEMPKLSGLNFAKLINKNTKIIFTTAHREFAIESYELNATDYLLKPFSFERFLKAVQKVAQPVSKNVESKNSTYIYVKVNKQMVKVSFLDLLYVEGMSNYIKVHTSAEVLVVYEKLSTIINSLPSSMFARIHKSYIVNISKIKLYTKEYVEIQNKHIPISSTYRNSLFDMLG